MRLRGYDKAFVPLRVFFIDAIVLDFLPQRIEIQHDAVAWTESLHFGQIAELSRTNNSRAMFVYDAARQRVEVVLLIVDDYSMSGIIAASASTLRGMQVASASPPSYLATMSLCIAKRSTILPLPSSPHCAPMTTSICSTLRLVASTQRVPYVC